MLAALLGTGPAHADPLERWAWQPGNCPHGLHEAPSGPFAVLLFCNDALGDHLAVIWNQPLDAPSTRDGRWSLEDRYWHEVTWGADVTGFRWEKNSTRLRVSTSSVYGSGGVFLLDVPHRTYRQLLPKGRKVSVDDPGPGYDITGTQEGKGRTGKGGR